MFIPLYDSNHLRSISLQYVTFGLIAANVVVYLATTLGGAGFTTAAVLGLGFIPSVVHDTAVLPAQYALLPSQFSYLTYSFLHADILHLGGIVAGAALVFLLRRRGVPLTDEEKVVGPVPGEPVATGTIDSPPADPAPRWGRQ